MYMYEYPVRYGVSHPRARLISWMSSVVGFRVETRTAAISADIDLGLSIHDALRGIGQ